MTLFTRIGAMLIAGVAFGAPFSAAAQSNDATSVSLSAVTGPNVPDTSNGDVTVTASDSDINAEADTVDFFASAAATGAITFSTSSAKTSDAGATAGSIAPGQTGNAVDDAAFTAVYGGDGTTTITFELEDADEG